MYATRTYFYLMKLSRCRKRYFSGKKFDENMFLSPLMKFNTGWFNGGERFLSEIGNFLYAVWKFFELTL